MLHSLAPLSPQKAVFRDDVVFCVYLYQRWAYRVDRTRANEYGFAAEPAPAAEAVGGAPAAAAAAITAAEGSGAGAGGAVRRRGGGAAGAETGGAAAGAGGEEVKKAL